MPPKTESPESAISQSMIFNQEKELKDGVRVNLEVHDVDKLSEQDLVKLNELVRGAFPGTDDVEAPFTSRLDNPNAGPTLAYIARAANGEIVGVHSATILRSFATAPEHAKSSVIQLGSATVHPDFRKHGVMSALVDLSFAKIADHATEVAKSSGRFDEAQRSNALTQLQKNPMLFVETALTTGSDAGKPRVGPELRRMIIERAITNGWDPNHQDLETMTGNFYQAVISVEELQSKDGEEKIYRIEFAGKNDSTYMEEVNVGSAENPNPIQVRERKSSPVTYQLDLSESQLKEAFVTIATGINSIPGESGTEIHIEKVDELLEVEDLSDLISVVISANNPNIPYDQVEARILQLMREQAERSSKELKKIEGLLEEVRSAFARPAL